MFFQVFGYVFSGVVIEFFGEYVGFFLCFFV